MTPNSGDEPKLVASETTGWFFAPRYSPDGARLAASLNRPGGDFGLSFFDLRDSSTQRTSGRILFMRDWSPDGRYVYAQGLREMYRVDARGNRAPEPVLSLPWRDPYCMPVGVARPATFVCSAADYTSDVWVIDNVGGETGGTER